MNRYHFRHESDGVRDNVDLVTLFTGRPKHPRPRHQPEARIGISLPRSRRAADAAAFDERCRVERERALAFRAGRRGF